jgi:hypothetical protein
MFIPVQQKKFRPRYNILCGDAIHTGKVAPCLFANLSTFGIDRIACGASMFSLPMGRRTAVLTQRQHDHFNTSNPAHRGFSEKPAMTRRELKTQITNVATKTSAA